MPERPEVVAQAALVAVDGGVPAILWGPPGEGKTQTVLWIARRLGLHAEVVLGSIRDQVDFAGLPFLGDAGVVVHPPAWAVRAVEAASGALVFLDELTTVPEAVQAAMLRVVLDRQVGDLALPDSVRIVAAANPPEDAPAGVELAPPLANRFAHLWYEMDVATFTEGMRSGWPDDSAPEAPARGRAPAGLVSEWGARIAGFIERRPGLLRASDKDGQDRSGPWASPRSWEMAARALAAAEHSGCSSRARGLLVRGIVGDGAGLELLSFLADFDLPSPEEVLAHPELLLAEERPDRLAAMLDGVASAVEAAPGPERLRRAWSALLGVIDAGQPDVAAVAGRRLARLHPKGAPAPEGLRRLLPLIEGARAGGSR